MTKTTFKEFLIEAEIDEDDLERVLSVFSRRIPRLLGSKAYRYGGDGYVEDVGGGKRITYLFGDRAYGVRYTGGRVKGIDVWTKFGLQLAPDFYIDISKLSAATIVGAMSKLAQIIKSPKAGDLEVKNISEAIKLDEMASRVSNDDFYDFLKDKYGEKASRRLSWEQIRAVADDNDVLIPGYIKSQKIGKGEWDGQPPAKGTDSSSDAPIEVSSKGETFYIRVSKMDPDSKALAPTGDNAAAKALYKKLRNLDDPDDKPSEEEMRDVDTLYGHLSQLVTFACQGTIKSLLIYGGPGTGKTFTIMQTVKQMGLQPGQDYAKMSGKASPIKIYELLYMYRNNGMVIFDDLDSMWRNEDATNILKAALDTSPVREISWDSNNTMNISKMSKEAQQDYMSALDRQISGVEEPPEEEDDDNDDSWDDEEKPKKAKKPVLKRLKFPATFEFTGRVVFISNLKKEEFDSAIMSRSAKIDMSLTAEEVLKRMRSIIGSLGGDDVAVERKHELLDHLLVMNKEGKLEEVTMREFIKGMNILRSGAPNWKDLIQYA